MLIKCPLAYNIVPRSQEENEGDTSCLKPKFAISGNPFHANQTKWMILVSLGSTSHELAPQKPLWQNLSYAYHRAFKQVVLLLLLSLNKCFPKSELFMTQFFMGAALWALRRFLREQQAH
jgi:hypothetical protein